MQTIIERDLRLVKWDTILRVAARSVMLELVRLLGEYRDDMVLSRKLLRGTCPADAFRPHLQNRLVKEGLAKIKEKFASPEHVGPKMGR